MFDTLSGKFAGAFSTLRSRGKISEKDVDATTADIRQALLEADVALEVVESFAQKVRQRALEVLPTLQSGTNQAQAIFDVVNQELTEILGGGARLPKYEELLRCALQEKGGKIAAASSWPVQDR